jgi:trehalose 6-phosphate phosphatase
MSKLLFSSQGKEALSSFLRHSSLLGFDFDGTLVAIASDPQRVKLNRQVHDLLKNLSHREKVIVISGRAKQDVKKFLRLRNVKVIGNHGLEDKRRRPRRQTVEVWKKILLENLRSWPGVNVEDKNFTLSVHYRKARQRPLAARRIKKLLETLVPAPRVIPGKFVFNLLPVSSGGKGQALQRLMKQVRCSHSIFIGDDVTDEEVFKLSRKKVLGIRVGRSQRSAASFHLARQSDVPRLLRLVSELLSQKKVKRIGEESI